MGVCQIVSGSVDPYTNFYTQIVLEGNKNKLDAMQVLDMMQIMGNEMYTAAQGKESPSKQEISMYSGDSANRDNNGQERVDQWWQDAVCYWCGAKGHKKFKCKKFKNGEARTAG